MRTSSPPTVIKQERSPSPTVSARFLQTSGAKYFGPLPANCVKGAPGYDKNRKAWAAREARRMERKSFLKTGRMFIRFVDMDRCEGLALILLNEVGKMGLSSNGGQFMVLLTVDVG